MSTTPSIAFEQVKDLRGGLSGRRLRYMHEVMKGYVDRKELSGLITMICRKGESFIDVIGNKALDQGDLMQRDTIFRITSMTKLVTAVAAMMLVEECKLRLDEPVDRYLPELADRKVLRGIESPLGDTVPAQRPITLRDLLTFRLGWGSIGRPAGHCPILQAIDELKLVGFGAPNVSTSIDADEWLKRLSTLPLMYQPGERWLYNTGSYLLGVLIERVSGKSLDAFMRGRIFEPLGMKDTSFYVPEEKLSRLATSYWANSNGGLDLYDGVENSAWRNPPVFHDGGAGLVSTVDDCLAFGQMLLNKGRFGKEHLLSRLSVEAMTVDQLTPQQKAVSGFFPGYFDHMGWGLGMAVMTGRNDLSAVPGRFGWDGGFGTSLWIDPKENMVAILMTQRAAFPLMSKPYLDFWTLVYGAIED